MYATKTVDLWFTPYEVPWLYLAVCVKHWLKGTADAIILRRTECTKPLFLPKFHMHFIFSSFFCRNTLSNVRSNPLAVRTPTAVVRSATTKLKSANIWKSASSLSNAVHTATRMWRHASTTRTCTSARTRHRSAPSPNRAATSRLLHPQLYSGYFLFAIAVHEQPIFQGLTEQMQAHISDQNAIANHTLYLRDYQLQSEENYRRQQEEIKVRQSNDRR